MARFLPLNFLGLLNYNYENILTIYTIIEQCAFSRLRQIDKYLVDLNSIARHGRRLNLLTRLDAADLQIQ